MNYSPINKGSKRGFYYSKRARRFLLKSYQVFINFSPTRRYVAQMRKTYEMLCPEDERTTICRAMAMSYIIWITSAIVMFFIFVISPSIYTAGIASLLVFVLNKEMLERRISGMEMTLLKQMNKFLSDTRHSFYKHGMIDEAIVDSSEKSGRIMKVNADKILEHLESSDKATSIRRYNETVSNRFLRMFLSVVVYVEEFGDKIVGGISVLLLNINILKSDIYIELMNRKETDYKFSGMTFIVLAPVYTLRIIRNWVVDMVPELITFYDGILGISLMIIIFLLTIIMYNMVNELRERNTVRTKEHYIIKALSRVKPIHKALNNYEEKNPVIIEKLENLLYQVGESYTGKQFFFKRILYGFVGFSICIFISISVHEKNKVTIVSSPVFISKSENLIPERYRTSSENLVLELMNDYIVLDTSKQGRLNPNREEIELEIRKKTTIPVEAFVTTTTDEVMVRIQKYNNEYFHWYELIFAVFIAYIAYIAPYLMLLYRKKVLTMNMGNEVAQFQSIIMMVMHLDNTTVLQVLEQMESFAVVFKESLRASINDYSSGDLDALEKLKIREPYEPFRRLIDNLIIADRIGIQKAFDEVVEERKVSQEMRNQDYRIARDKKVVVATIMSFVPAVLTVTLFWIVPFSLNALEGLKEYDEMINNFR